MELVIGLNLSINLYIIMLSLHANVLIISCLVDFMFYGMFMF